MNNPDLKMLGFLWQWKLVTTSALARKFFTHIKPDSAYRRLKKLESRGLIQMFADPTGSNYFWTLTSRGFKAIRAHLPALSEDGFKSENLAHDSLVTVFHLGEWLRAVPTGAQFFSEQQLRRITPCNVPDWIPCDRYHRPDGYSIVDNDLYAFEVELSPKTEAHYHSIGGFYDRMPNLKKFFGWFQLKG